MFADKTTGGREWIVLLRQERYIPEYLHVPGTKIHKEQAVCTGRYIFPGAHVLHSLPDIPSDSCKPCELLHTRSHSQLLP